MRKVLARCCYTWLKGALIHLFYFFVEPGLKHLGLSYFVSSKCSLVEVISDGYRSLLLRHIHHILRLTNLISVYIKVVLVLF